MKLEVKTAPPAPPEITGVTIELTAAEARALLEVIDAPSSTGIHAARIRSYKHSPSGVYPLQGALKRALA